MCTIQSDGVPWIWIFLRFLAWGTGFELAFSRWIVLPFFSKYGQCWSILTWNKGDSWELIEPFICDFNCLSGFCLMWFGNSNLVGVFYDRTCVPLHDAIKDVKEVTLIGFSSFRELWREIAHELIVVLHSRPKVLHRYLIETWHVYSLDLVEWHEQFFSWKDLLQKVLIPNQTNSNNGEKAYIMYSGGMYN